MKIINSRTNQEIQDIHALKQEKTRAQMRCFVAEGIRTCTTLLAHSVELVTLYATEPLVLQAEHLLQNYYQNNLATHTNRHADPDTDTQKDTHNHLHNTGNNAGQKNLDSYLDAHLVQVSESVMGKISSTTTPSGLLAVFRVPTQPSPDTLTSGLVLAEISNPGNMGTLIRSAAAMNVRSVVIVGGSNPWSSKVIQASAGAIGAIKIFNWTWQELMRYKKEKELYALIVSNGEPLTTISRDNALLVIGNEAHGLSTIHIHDCEHRVTIPMPGGTESLNAAIAGSIALYITFAQR